MAARPRRRDGAGIALVLVLWVLALLTVMALGLTTAQRTESALTRNQLDAARFRALADAGINLVALELMRPALDPAEVEAEMADSWVPDGQPRSLRFDGFELEVGLYNEASRLDLNAATREQLAALVQLAQGDEAVDETLPDRIADAIVDWRDSDDLAQVNGAEDGDYEAAGLPYGARDGPFESVEELREVLGMTRELYQVLAPDLTVNNPSGRIDEQFASANLLAVTQGLTLDDAQQLIEQRRQPLLPDAAPAVPLSRGGPLYRIRISLARGDAARRTMEALVQIQRGGRDPVVVLWRRYGLLDTAPSGAERTAVSE
jgi:general secretion pathway protein K